MQNTSSYHHHSRPASRFALKNKTTGDFLSHVNYTATVEASALDNYSAKNINEVQKNRNRIAGNGTEGAWYKHDENRNYRDTIKSRLPSADGKKIKEQQENSFSRIPPSTNSHQIFMRTGVMREQVTKNCSKIRGNHETPLWFVHPENLPYNQENDDDDDEMMAVKTRLTSEDALYYRDRNKLGNNHIFGEDSDNEDIEIKMVESNWRPETRTGLHPRAESDLWFHHEEFDPQQNCLQTSKNYSSQTVRETVEKSQGKEMLKILQQVPSVEDPLKIFMIRKKSFQEQSTNSTMQYILDEKSNENFKNATGYPRAVKPEGIEIFKKNKDGSLVQCLGGYPDKACKKDVHKVSNLDEELLKKYKGVNMAKAIVGDLLPTSRNIAPRVIKSEAEKNAIKNRGSMKDIFTRTNNINKSEQIMNGPRLRSKEAMEIARRYHYGSIKNLLF